MLTAQVRGSAERLAQWLDEDFLEFGCCGRIFQREAVLRELPAEAADEGRIEASDFQVRRVGADVALVTYRSRCIGTDGTVRMALRSSLWRKKAAGWRMLFHQGTVVSP